MPTLDLAGIAQWVVCGPVNETVTVRFQSGPVPGFQARSPARGTRGNHTLIFLSLSFSFPPPFSKNK